MTYDCYIFIMMTKFISKDSAKDLNRNKIKQENGEAKIYAYDFGDGTYASIME